MAVEVKYNVPLCDYTSFAVGGPAQKFALVKNTDELLQVLKDNDQDQVWLLGYGSNTLVSDKGLPGLTVCIHGGEVQFDDNSVMVDAGVWWDDVVQASIKKGLWGAELMSEIPGSVGAALYINITAYGQAIGPLVEWVEVWDPTSKSVRKFEKTDLKWSYKSSIFQNPANKGLVILRARLNLSNNKTNELTYQKALDVAEELGLDTDDLEQRRKIIIEARKRAGSIWHPDDKKDAHTAGSFFRNPMVSPGQADKIMSFDETGKTKEQIQKMNQVHGGNALRVSAAHVMLAAGFKRGQTWGNVKLNDHNLLKIEAEPGATAQEIYNVVREIQQTVREKLDIELEPEASLLGDFGA